MTTEELTIEVTRHEERLNTLEGRQDKLDGLVSSMATISQKQTTMEGDISEIKTDVKELTQLPAKRWETVVGVIISAVVAFIIGYVLK